MRLRGVYLSDRCPPKSREVPRPEAAIDD